MYVSIILLINNTILIILSTLTWYQEQSLRKPNHHLPSTTRTLTTFSSLLPIASTELLPSSLIRRILLPLLSALFPPFPRVADYNRPLQDSLLAPFAPSLACSRRHRTLCGCRLPFPPFRGLSSTAGDSSSVLPYYIHDL